MVESLLGVFSSLPLAVQTVCVFVIAYPTIGIPGARLCNWVLNGKRSVLHDGKEPCPVFVSTSLPPT
ncbi:MAG: hypothetical protein V4678_04020 [Patescibacteria group bacterium]